MSRNTNASSVPKYKYASSVSRAGIIITINLFIGKHRIKIGSQPSGKASSRLAALYLRICSYMIWFEKN